MLRVSQFSTLELESNPKVDGAKLDTWPSPEVETFLKGFVICFLWKFILAGKRVAPYRLFPGFHHKFSWQLLATGGLFLQLQCSQENEIFYRNF